MQTVNSKHYGDIVFKKTWRAHNGHIGLRANGVYSHFNGLPITKIEDLREVIADPDDLALALDWFEYRLHAEVGQPKVRKVYFELEDRTYRYIDTHQVVDTLDSLHAALRDETLESALLWFSRYYRKSRIAERDNQPPVVKMLDEQVIDLLAVEPGLSVQAIQRGLEAEARVLVETLDLLQQRGDVVRQGKVYYLSTQIEVTV